MNKIIFGLFLTLFASGALAQSPPVNLVTAAPYATVTHNDSSAIAVTNTFQSIWAQSTNNRGRAGCTVQNTGTNPMYVYFGPIASATIAKSLKITVGQSVSCNVGTIVLQDQVSITGTTLETYYAGQQ